MKKVKITPEFVKDNLNNNDINKITCSGKTLFNKVMLVLFLLSGVICSYFIVSEFVFSLKELINMILLLLLISSPTIYYILKIINFEFTVDSNRINYKNIFGKKYSYLLSDIFSAKFFSAVYGASVDSIVIKFNDKRKIIVSSVCTNFEVLKQYLISKNILIL